MLIILILTLFFCSTHEILKDYKLIDRNGNKIPIYSELFYAIRNQESGNYFSPRCLSLSNELNNNAIKNWLKVHGGFNWYNFPMFEVPNDDNFVFNVTKYSQDHYLIGKIKIL